MEMFTALSDWSTVAAGAIVGGYLIVSALWKHFRRNMKGE